MTANEVKNLLKIYYDIPAMISAEFATIRNCETEKNGISLPSVNLSGLPGGKGLTGDRTASMALANQERYYDEEIKACSRRIAELRDARNWLGVALGKLDQTDRYILELRYMGDPKNRKYRRRPEWKEIADKVELSESQTRERVRIALLKLMIQADQIVLPGMIR
ncbi:hypothetical protein EQM14_05645 [Caproiciproducens sp. NJN-50]|uniref:hypothetical protein n=1 Tax=Acutalibacteraceae TaxID=3082771 RepID=UPI000FFE2A9E|nr:MULTISPECIES: hypothetical protein [Acutalibacteraceae]QAT49303.1 hypothetical protein EQM14_05645 [Caproiciproducens sp. NJN-50]